MSTPLMSRGQYSFFASLMIVGLLTSLPGCAGRGLGLLVAPRSAEMRAVENAAVLEQINQRYQAGESQAAYDAVRKHRRKHPYSWETRITEACIAADLGRTAESIQAWQAVAALQPNSAKVQHEAGMRLVQLGAVPTGLPVLQAAVDNDPSNVKYRLDLSAAYLASGNSHTAQAVLMQAHRQLPQNPDVPVAIARVFESQNIYNRAAHYYGVALKQLPDDPTLLRQRGRMWYQLGNFELARIDLAACEESMIAGEHWPALLEYGRICLKTGDVQSARRVAMALGEKPTALTPDFQEFSVAVAAAPMPMPAIVPEPEPFSPPDAPPALLAAAPRPTFVAQRAQPIQQVTGIIVVNTPPPAQPIAHTQPAEIPSVIIPVAATLPSLPPPPELAPPAAAPVILSGPLLIPPTAAPPAATTGWRTTRSKSKVRKQVPATPPAKLKSPATKTNDWKPRVRDKRERRSGKAADAQTIVKKKAATD